MNEESTTTPEVIRENLQRFVVTKEKLADAGYDVVSPADDELNGITRPSWLDYMRDGIKLLTDCNAIYMMNGWHTSRGATLELQIAVGLGYKILFED